MPTMSAVLAVHVGVSVQVTLGQWSAATVVVVWAGLEPSLMDHGWLAALVPTTALVDPTLASLRRGQFVYIPTDLPRLSSFSHKYKL